MEADVQAAKDTGGVTAAAPVRAAAPSGPEPKASPLAKRIAAERGIDLRQVQGTGPGGRIVQSDVENASAVPAARTPAAAAAVDGPKPGERIPVRGMRKTIASRMHHSLQESAQLTMDMEVNMEDAVKMRTSLVEGMGLQKASSQLTPTWSSRR